MKHKFNFNSTMPNQSEYANNVIITERLRVEAQVEMNIIECRGNLTEIMLSVNSQIALREHSSWQ